MHQMELKESTRGGRNEVMLEWDLQHLHYSGRPGRAETEQMPSACSFAFSFCRETHQEPGQLCDVLLSKNMLVNWKRSPSPLLFPPCHYHGLVIAQQWDLSRGDVRNNVVFSQEVQQGGMEQGALQLPVVRRQHPYCSEVYDCLAASWDKGSCG